MSSPVVHGDLWPDMSLEKRREVWGSLSENERREVLQSSGCPSPGEPKLAGVLGVGCEIEGRDGHAVFEDGRKEKTLLASTETVQLAESR